MAKNAEKELENGPNEAETPIENKDENSALAKLKNRRATRKAKFTRACNRATVIIETKGSRTELANLFRDVDNAFEEVEEANNEYSEAVKCQSKLSKEDISQELSLAGKYMKDIEMKHFTMWKEIREYYASRAEDTSSLLTLSSKLKSRSSHASSFKGSAALAALEVKHAELKLKIKELELKQIDKRSEQEKQVKIQVAKDNVEAAKLEYRLRQDAASGFQESPVVADLQDFGDDMLPPKQKASKVDNWIAKTDFSVGEKRIAENAPSHASRWINFDHRPPPPVVETVTQRSPFTKSLPKIELPKFGGKYAEWPRWIKLFKALVHDQPNLTNTEKLTHLQSAVTGLAQQTIAGMFFDGALYEQAVKALEDRFGRDEDIVHASLNATLTSPPIAQVELSALEKLQATLHCTVSTLENLGYTEDLNSSENLRRLVTKLPNELKREWGKRVIEIEPARPSMRDLDMWLGEQVRILLSCPTTNSSKFKRNFQSSSDKSHAVTTLATGTTLDSQPTPMPCPECKESHKLQDCPKYKAMDPSQRAQKVAEYKLCFCCLRPGHRSKRCRKAKPCGVDGCTGRHHPTLHGSARVFPRHGQASSNDVQPSGESRNVNFLDDASQASRVIVLQVAPVTIHGPSGNVKTFALLDPGSQTSLCNERLIEKLGITGKSESLCINTVAGRGESKKTTMVSLQITPVGDGCKSQKIQVDEVWAVPDLSLQVPTVSMKDTSKLDYLDGIQVSYPATGQVDLLLGASVSEAVVQHEVRVGRPMQPIAIRTDFGWALSGRVSNLKSEDRHVNYTSKFISPDEKLQSMVKDWWATESFGTMFENAEPVSKEDRRAMDILEKSTRKVGNRYETALLWKHDNVMLPNNYSMALKRLQSTEAKLKRDGDAETYSKTFSDYIEQGYARKLTREEVQKPTTKRWYLPHHAVKNPNKPGKLRTVFDAAATYQGISLNSQLLTGPDLLQSLPGVVLRFREEPIALVADVQAMYHQVQVIEEDQPALSFLWRDMDAAKPPDVYQMQVVILGARCSPTIANYVLHQTATDHCLNPEMNAVKEAIFKNFYMDDFLKALKSVTPALAMRVDVDRVLEKGGFKLRGWMSNSREVIAKIPEPVRAAATIDLKSDHLPEGKALGVLWNAEDDTIGFKFRDVSTATTKRGVLSRIAIVFDPLGIAAPALLYGKLLVQQLWSKKVSWDEELDEEDLKIWRSWLDDLPVLQELKIPRCWKSTTDVDEEPMRQELHVFCDASSKAMTAVAYLRFVYTNQGPHCSFVMSKSRLAPLKTLSIVRLELQAAVLAVRLGKTILKEITFKPDLTTYWSDSQVVLGYLRNESRRFHTFVANRVAEVHESTIPQQWRHVPGELNPADDGTRGVKATELTERSKWLNGPEFLSQESSSFPSQQPEQVDSLQPEDPEVKLKVYQSTVVRSPDVMPLPDTSKFSSWLRYCRAAAWMRRFANNLGAKHCQKLKAKTGPLSVEEIKSAEIVVLRTVQAAEFVEEYTALKSGRQLASKSHLLEFTPYLDEDKLMRVGGRLKNAPVREDTKHPVLLPNHDVVRLIVFGCHKKVLHAGVQHTLHEFRKLYWLPKARSRVKKILHSCCLCIKRRSKPRNQMMADLPLARFDTSHAFSSSGIDYFGPLLVRNLRKTEKRYGLLITCLSTRAIHLEVAYSLDTDSFLLALRRFIARRGSPKKIFSDNGGNFTAGDKELRDNIERWNQQQIADELSQNHTEWHFNPPTASHMGGIWERMVGSVKRHMRVLLGNALVRDDVLHTAFAEIEFILNSRPVTHVSTSVHDPEALTPNHLLLGRAVVALPPCVVDSKDMYRKGWRQAQAVADNFWQRWHKEYVPMLMSRKKWCHPTRNIVPGDVVLLAEDNVSRGHWPLARVMKSFPGPDGYVRSAEVKTARGSYVRPISKLCLLEFD